MLSPRITQPKVNISSSLLDLGQVGDQVDKDVDALEEGGLVQELVMVVEEGGRVGHRGEADGGYAHLPQVP